MRAAMSALALATCACGSEPSFDERFSQSENKIEERARELDEKLSDADAKGASKDGSEVQRE
jgi:hypothetical protein